MSSLSPIARKQRALYGADHGLIMMPGNVLRRVHLRAGNRLGYFGAATSSIYSGPPVGEGSKTGAIKGAQQGAAAGSVAGPIGTAIGAIAGAIGGAIAGSIGKVDPENANFAQAIAIYNANPNGVLALVNKYLPLAGLFDLRPNQIKGNIPIYKRYGRMGEQPFVTDMALQIYNAAQTGRITGDDTPASIMAKVVQPWIDSWGFGAMQDNNAGLINMLLLGLIIDYVSGNQSKWKAVGGDFPFKTLPAFALPQAAPPPASVTAPPPVTFTPTTSITPTPVIASASVPPPSNVLSTDGSVATPGSNTAIKVPAGTLFYFGPNPVSTGDFPVYSNGLLNGPAGIGLLLSNNNHLYLKNMAGNWSVWLGESTWTSTSDPTAARAPVVSTPTTVPIPAGFTVSSADAATGLPVYSTNSGGYFSWNGTTMTPFTGTLINGGVVQGGGLIGSNAPGSPVSSNLPSLTTGSQQLFNSALPPLSAPVDTSVPSAGTAQTLPATVQPATAGVTGAGLPSWAPWAAIGGVLVLMFATARPVGRLPKPRRS